MDRRRLVVGLLLAALAPSLGCDGCAPSGSDGGVRVADAGGTPLADAAAGQDGGGSLDAGSTRDGGAPGDGGAADDGGAPGDGGASGDGGQSDAADASDAGSFDDAGDASDGGDAGGGDGADLPCPDAGLAVRLTWTTVGDLDLHLSLDGADWCSDEDCWWANCAPDASLPLEWDGVPGESAGDPRLLVDDSDGFGPEVICLEQPFVAEYVVGVRYQTFSDWPATGARLEVFSGGVLVEEVGLDALSPSEFWQPGRVVVTAGELSFVVEPRRCQESDGWLCQDEPGACPALP